ncbi:MAG: hypothetical protein ACLUEV_00615 [Alistipes sp.]
MARQLAGGELDAVVARAIAENGWFTRQSVAQAIEAICTDLLDETVLRDWLARYPRPDASAVRRVQIVLAATFRWSAFSTCCAFAFAGTAVS